MTSLYLDDFVGGPRTQDVNYYACHNSNDYGEGPSYEKSSKGRKDAEDTKKPLHFRAAFPKLAPLLQSDRVLKNKGIGNRDTANDGRALALWTWRRFVGRVLVSAVLAFPPAGWRHRLSRVRHD